MGRFHHPFPEQLKELWRRVNADNGRHRRRGSFRAAGLSPDAEVTPDDRLFPSNITKNINKHVLERSTLTSRARPRTQSSLPLLNVGSVAVQRELQTRGQGRRVWRSQSSGADGRRRRRRRVCIRGHHMSQLSGSERRQQTKSKSDKRRNVWRDGRLISSCPAGGAAAILCHLREIIVNKGKRERDAPSHGRLSLT